jgi:P2 family phage contractile tail tube protein
MLPKTMKAFNLFREGDNWAGIVENIVPPKITRKREDWRGGGMNAGTKLDMGYEIGQLEFTLKEYTPEIIKDWGECGHDGVLMRLLAGMQKDDSECTTSNVEIIVRGRPSEIDFGTMKSGDLTDMKIPFDVSYFKYVVDGETLIELDPVNMIEIIGGVDRYEKLRNAIGA